MKRKALVVGLGRMGRLHRMVLESFDFRVETVDPGQEDADFPSLSGALTMRNGHGSAAYDVAVVAVPIPLLARTAFALAGIPMLVEKPFAMTDAEARHLGAYLTARGPVCVGYVERFNPQYVALSERLGGYMLRQVRAIRFTRWNDRPSDDVVLDLATHDTDLYWDLCRRGPLGGTVSFDVRAGQSEKVRRIEVDLVDRKRRRTLEADLMDHNESPLHELWKAFLAGRRVPSASDAARAIELARVWEQSARCVAE